MIFPMKNSNCWASPIFRQTDLWNVMGINVCLMIFTPTLRISTTGGNIWRMRTSNIWDLMGIYSEYNGIILVIQ